VAKSPLAELSFQRRLSVLKMTGRSEARPRCTCSSELNHVGHIVCALGRVDQILTVSVLFRDTCTLVAS